MRYAGMDYSARESDDKLIDRAGDDYVFLCHSPDLAARRACVRRSSCIGRVRTRSQGGGGAADEINWARAALARNPQIEVVASDSETGVFTIRDKQTGAVQVVSLHDIAAGPAAQFKTMTPAAAPAPPALPESTAVPQPPEPSSDRDRANCGACCICARASRRRPAQSAATGSGNYTIERTGGQLRVSGPGVSIVSSGQAADGGRAELAQRTAEPIICEGRRMLHFDNRDVYVDGDAITVRDGCEMFITNSRIVASGTGVTVRNAVVHVSNSHIEGAGGSFDVDADSKMYVRGSTFQGLSRRAELAMVQDQGGNRWR